MGKIWALIVIVVAVVLAILLFALPHTDSRGIIGAVNFFNIMIPVLGVGALIKYLCCCNKKSCD
jgi:hypothetical protein